MYDIPIDMKLNIFSYLKNDFLNWRLLNKEHFAIFSFFKNCKLNVKSNSYNLNWRKRPNDWVKANLLLKRNKLINSEICFNIARNNILLKAKYKVFENKWYIYEKNKVIAYIKFDKFKALLCRPNNSIWAIFTTKFYDRCLNIKLLNINSLPYENKCENEYEIVIKNKKPHKSGNKKNKVLYLKFENSEIAKPSIKNTSFISYESGKCVFEFGKSKDNEIIAFYKKPLHGLLAFSLCIIKLT